MSAWCAELSRGQRAVSEVVKEYFRRLTEVESHRTLEIHSALRIQRLFRGHVVRQHLAFLHSNAKQVQRVWRGLKGRHRASVARREHNNHRLLQHFHACATVVQRVFRGHWTRVHVQDYYARKAYIEGVEQQSKVVMKSLKEEERRQEERVKVEAEEEAHAKFTDMTQNLHHLLSTKACMGVFSSPFGEQHAVTAYGIPLEDHIRDSYQNLRTQSLQRKQQQ